METPKPKYPPPITMLPFVMKRKCTSDGRLILTMEKPHDDDEDMKAHRSNDGDVKDVNNEVHDLVPPHDQQLYLKRLKNEVIIKAEIVLIKAYIASSGSGERAFSRNGDDDENGCTSKDQSAFLEESFKEHNTLNPMTEISSIGNHEISLTVKDDSIQNSPCPPPSKPMQESPLITFSLPFMQKDKVVTLPGISIVWGLAVMVLVYSVGHISGAHFNPSVTIAFATCKRFPWKQVPAYVAAQVLGSTLAAGTLRLLFSGKQDHFVGTVPAGSDMQSFVMEFIITFYLMFIIGDLAGLAIGATVLLNVMPISGASMNPARTLGPAIVSSQYKGIWIYMVAPILGAVCGAWVYNMVRYTDKPLREITKSASFFKATTRT
ncbi:hypothetical protein Q3G72_030757 [Acer saccharum]|nr:hypothetical protein Q3G72_030757 [Acer saccharum]